MLNSLKAKDDLLVPYHLHIVGVSYKRLVRSSELCEDAQAKNTVIQTAANPGLFQIELGINGRLLQRARLFIQRGKAANKSNPTAKTRIFVTPARDKSSEFCAAVLSSMLVICLQALWGIIHACKCKI